MKNGNSDYPTCLESRVIEVNLEKFQVGFRQVLDEAVLSPTVDIDFDPLFQNWMLKVRGYIWSEHLQRTEVEYPCDWWQAFKDRWFPKWAKEKWPVKYTEHIIDIKCLYPNFRPSIPDQSYNMILQVNKAG